tara:strand:- start:17097 stop:17306 length:210 start_codon:yes stop_codon:yes gene_type:complete
MDKSSKEIEVVGKHIQELEGLQNEYAEKIALLDSQRNDFSILIEALKKEKSFLEGIETQAPLELADAES